MQKFYRRIFITLVAVLVTVTSGVFFVSYPAGPGTGAVVELEPEPSVSEPDPPAPTVSEPEPSEPPDPGPPDGAVIEHALPLDPVLTDGPWASPHFLMEEYACDCGGYCDGWPAKMDPLLLEKVEQLRCSFDRPIIITSGVRCERRNAEVGGIASSWHLSGHAADLYCPGIPCDEVARAARELGLGVIEYPDREFDHVEIWR